MLVFVVEAPSGILITFNEVYKPPPEVSTVFYMLNDGYFILSRDDVISTLSLCVLFITPYFENLLFNFASFYLEMILE